MAVDYLKTYLGIDPNDYSSMEARIRGEEPQARTPVMMRQPMMMPQQKSLGDIEAMQLIPRQQPAPQPAPQVDDRYQGLMDQIAALRSQIEGMQAPVVEEAPVMAPTPAVVEAPTPAPAVMSEPFQAPPEIENRAVENRAKPEPIPQAPAEDIQASINYLAGLPKMNIPQIPDIEEIKRKMAEANMNFPEPVSYQDQLQAIRDLPPMNQMPTREEIQMAMQNMPTPIGANITQNPFQKINDILPQSTIDQFQSFASKPNPFVPQAPQMQSVGRPSMPISRGFRPEMRASGGGIDQAIYDLKFKLNG
jgi:hypothetical protein